MMNSQNLSRFKYEIILFFILLVGLGSCCPFYNYEDSLLNEYYPIQETIIDQVSPSQTFAFWSFSIPLWNVKSYPQVEQQATSDTRLYQLMFLLKSIDDDRVVMFMYAILDDDGDSVIHRLRVEKLDDWGWPGFSSYSFEYDPREYEGTWLLTMITIQQKQVIFQTSNYVTNNNIGDILQELNKVKFIIGGTGYIDVFTVGIFRGRLSNLIQFTDYSETKFEEIENNCQIPEKVVGEQIIELFPQLFIFKGDTQSIFSIDQVGKRFCISGWVKYDAIDALETIQYLLLRLTTNQNYGNYLYMGDEILKISAQLNRINAKYSAYYVDSIQYSIPVRQQNVIPDTRTYAWLFIDEFPYMYLDALTSWHYIQFEYGRTTGPKTLLKIKYFAGNLDLDQDSFGDSTNSGFFINTKYYAIFGSDMTNIRRMKGSVSNFIFTYNYDSDKDFIYQCHYTCQTCIGPLENNCLTCSEDQNRILIEDKHQCICENGFLEKDKICLEFNFIYPTLNFNEIIQDSQFDTCQFGYFRLPTINNCIQCPQQSTSDLLCVDCLFNQTSWYLKPQCTTDYITQQKQINDDAYRKQVRSPLDYDLYVINQDNNLELIQGAQDFCNNEDELPECFQISQQSHLNKKVFVICKQNHYFQNNQCIFSNYACLKTNLQQSTCQECKDGYYLNRDQQCEICPNLCLTCKMENNNIQCLSCPSTYEPVGASCIKCGLNCSLCQLQMNYYINNTYLKCLKCVDHYKYYLSLNGVDCIENTIENCLIAFEIVQDNKSINSLDYNFIPHTGNIITKCAQCDKSYCYNESTMACELTEYPECDYCIYTPDAMFSWECLYGPRTLDVDPDSTFDNGPMSFTQQCSGYNQNCFLCMYGQMNFEISYLCLICEDGYFANKLTGQCEPCPVELFCQKCYQQDKYSKDDWKTKIRPYYRSQIDDNFQAHSFIEYGTSPNKEDYEIVCSNCQSEYELSNNQCILKCPENCLECQLINNENICIKCQNTIKGRNLSLDNNQCIICPINCSLCRQRNQDEITAINPIFNSYEFSYSSNQCLRGYTGIFDQFLGIYVDCISTICVKRMEINLNLFCDSDKYNRELMDLDQEEQIIQFKQSNILITDLFSSSSFKEFETQQFYLMANQKVIQNISIKIVSQESQTCIINGNKSIQQKFSENIFSAINVELLIQGNGFTTFQYERTLSIINFKNVQFDGIKLNPIQIGNIKYLLFQSAFLQSIQLLNIFYDCSIEQDKSQIIIKNAQTVIIDQFVSSNLNINNIDSFIKIESIESDQNIQIYNFNLLQCQLINTILFMLYTNVKTQVNIQNLQINSKFISTQLLNIQYGKLNMDSINIYNSELTQVDNLFNLESLTQININQFSIYQSVITSSIILSLNQNSHISNLRLNENQVLKNSIIIQNQKVNVLEYYFEQFIFELNSYDQDSKFIQIQQNLSPNKVININNIQVLGNKLTYLFNYKQLELQQTTLIYLLLEQVEITLLTIERANSIKEFSFIGINSLIINQATIKQYSTSLFQGLHLYIDCLTLQYYGTSIYIYDTTNIEFKSLTISTAESIDYPIINIQTSISKSTNDNFIKLSDLNLISNLLLITDQMKQISLIQLITQQEFQIDIINSIFKKNIMHQYRQNDLINSGLLLNFDCSYCTINIDNIRSESNIVTNTTDNIIYIKAKKITIKNSNFISNCIFDYSILQPYLIWGYNNVDEVFLEQIMEIFPIVVTTGNAKLISSDLDIQNVLISNSSGSGLYIRMENDAKIMIANSIFSYISTNFQSESENGGAIYLDTSNSVSTTIDIVNVTANNIFCGNKGGFVFLFNGLGSIQLSLFNTYFKDIYALYGSIIYSEFSPLTSQSQNIKFNKSRIINSIDTQLEFFNKFSMISESQILALIYKRFQILVYNAKQFQMENIIISNINFESFLFLQNTTSVQIQSILISSSNFIHKMIVLNDMRENSIIFINSIQIENIVILDKIGMESTCSKIEKKFNSQYKCLSDIKISPIKLSLKYDNINSLLNAYCILNQMNQFQQQQELLSVIDIHPSYTNMSISQVTLSSINCTICQNGLINVNFIDTHSYLLIQSLTLKQNSCGQSSCVNIIKISSKRLLYNLVSQVNEKQFDLKINDYLCRYNQAFEGTCLLINNIKTLIQKSIFKHNYAYNSGGSIKVIGNEIFYLVQSLIYNNTAKYGGGLQIEDQMSQNMTKFGTFVANNKAELFGNDSSQVPSQLSITINLVDILPKITLIEQENLLIQQILIKPYKVFSNEYSEAFYVPNGQKLSQYQYFDWNKGEYVPYNIHFRIIALDKQNQIQEDLKNTYCDISGRVLTENEENEFTKNFTNINRIEFNQSDYNLDDLIVYLDDQLNQTLQLQFQCNSIYIPIYDKNKEIVSYHNNYYLRINIKTLPCQMGEIKSQTDFTCVPCNVEQGQYSLSINSHTCLYKDDTTTSDIKSAQLKLKAGYWRPYFYTDQISECINLIDNCLGGWREGDNSCFEGHIGALCEECDLYNLRGDGQFSTSTKYSCGSCTEKNKNSIIITAITLWTLISILISVKSTVELLKRIAIKVRIGQNRAFSHMQDDQSGVLIKMLTNHLQIISTITTFQINMSSGVSNAIKASGNPMQTMAFSLDCFLIDMFDFSIHYSRMVWQMIMPLLYIFLFLSIYFIQIKIKKQSYNLSVITTTFIYMYIFLQPNLVGGFIQLISFRTISSYKWISANVAFRYDTWIHFKWLLGFCLPSFLVIAFLIPVIFFFAIYFNRRRLDDKLIRQQWGYLYNEYTHQAYFWEIVKILEKELLIIFLSYYDEYVVKKGILVLFVIYIYQELNIKYKPYSSPNLNKLDSYSANVCAISIALAIGIYIDQQIGSLEVQIPYFIILASLNIYYLFLLLKELLKAYGKELELQLDKVRDLIRLKAPWTQNYSFLRKLLANRQQQRSKVIERFKKIRGNLMKQVKNIIEFKETIRKQQDSGIVSLNALDNIYNVFMQYKTANSLQNLKDEKLLNEDRPVSKGQEKYEAKVYPLIVDEN